MTEHQEISPLIAERGPSVTSFRAWRFLVWLSLTQQMRAHLLVWISIGLLAFSIFVVFVNVQAGRLSMAHHRHPKRSGPTYESLLQNVERAHNWLPWAPTTRAIALAGAGAMRAALARSSSFFVFSNSIVFALYTTFLLPLWSLSFATESLGREREADNLIWLMTRPLPRPAIYLAKFIAILPWSLGLNLGGFALLCLAAGDIGRLAFAVYWPAVLLGTLAFCALFHLLGAIAPRPAVAAIFYCFFFETFFGNLPGHIKRLSISYYIRCIMFERAHALGIQPERPEIYVPVSAAFAVGVLTVATAALLAIGILQFVRREYLT